MQLFVGGDVLLQENSDRQVTSQTYQFVVTFSYPNTFYKYILLAHVTIAITIVSINTFDFQK